MISTEIQDQEWEQRCEQVSISPEDLNKLIMDFLATEVCFAACCAVHWIHHQTTVQLHVLDHRGGKNFSRLILNCAGIS